MDFSFTEEQEAVGDLARQILEGQITQERLRELEDSRAPYDERTWTELARAGLLGIALPEEAGGAGLGFLEVCRLLEQVGRTVAPVPVVPTVVMGALPVARFGTEEQRRRLLPPAAAGDLILTSALVEPGTEPTRPATTARREGGGWRLDGVKVCVPAGLVAARVLVPARTTPGARACASSGRTRPAGSPRPASSSPER
jgi:alkylation response protein AidB-like acyl-CoA dehydrogenase